MTSADGTTFIISYEYIDEGDLKQFTNNRSPTSTNQVPSPDEENDSEFLKGFLSGRDCLIGGTGWWKYELCYGKQVIQFHVNYCWNKKKYRNFRLFLKDEGEQRTSVLLGKWNPSKHIEWINTNPRRRTTGNAKERQYELFISIIYFQLFRYVPLYYTDGDQCPLTKAPRTVEVKLRYS
jgi:endoplasmic reticulum lectin 1